MAKDRPRLLILLPCDPQAARGNGTTAARLAQELERRAYAVELADVRNLDSSAPCRADGILALHAVHCGPTAQALAHAWKIPYVVLFSGTDLNGQPPPGAVTAVAQAAAAVALGRAAAKRARDIYPGCSPHLHIIPQAVAPLIYHPGMRMPNDAPNFNAESFLVLVPAGVRAIKDPLRAITALAPLQAQCARLQLWFIGPELEPSCGEYLRTACSNYTWVHWLQERPRTELLPLLRRADVVLSTSRSEGGPPNSLLEAVAVGCPVLASSIPAHREFPGAESCFRDDAELRKRLRFIMDEPEKTMMKSRKMEELVRQRHSPAAESLAWNRLLRPLLSPC